MQDRTYNITGIPNSNVSNMRHVSSPIPQRAVAKSPSCALQAVITTQHNETQIRLHWLVVPTVTAARHSPPPIELVPTVSLMLGSYASKVK
jgi:hypothetical protein